MGRGKRLNPLPFRKVDKILEDNGFRFVKSEGSHHKYKGKSKDGKTATVVVAKHPGEDIPVGTLRRIVRQSGLSRDKFLK